MDKKGFYQLEKDKIFFCLVEKGHLDSAIYRFLEKKIKAKMWDKSEFWDWAFELGLLYREWGRLNHSIRLFRRIVHKGPSYKKRAARRELAFSLKEAGKYEECYKIARALARNLTDLPVLSEPADPPDPPVLSDPLVDDLLNWLEKSKGF